MTSSGDFCKSGEPTPPPIEIADLDPRAVAYGRLIVAGWINPASQSFVTTLSPDREELTVRELASSLQRTAERTGLGLGYLSDLVSEQE